MLDNFVAYSMLFTTSTKAPKYASVYGDRGKPRSYNINSSTAYAAKSVGHKTLDGGIKAKYKFRGDQQASAGVSAVGVGRQRRASKQLFHA